MDQPMSQEELLEALAEQTRESVKFWKASHHIFAQTEVVSIR